MSFSPGKDGALEGRLIQDRYCRQESLWFGIAVLMIWKIMEGYVL